MNGEVSKFSLWNKDMSKIKTKQHCVIKFFYYLFFQSGPLQCKNANDVQPNPKKSIKKQTYYYFSISLVTASSKVLENIINAENLRYLTLKSTTTTSYKDFVGKYLE